MKLSNILLSKKKKEKRKEVPVLSSVAPGDNIIVENHSKTSDADEGVNEAQQNKNSLNIISAKQSSTGYRSIHICLEHLKLMRSMSDPLPRNMKIVVAFVQTHQLLPGSDNNNLSKKRVYTVSQISQPWNKTEQVEFQDPSFLQDSCEIVTASWDADNGLFLSANELDLNELELVVGLINRENSDTPQVLLPVLPIGQGNFKLSNFVPDETLGEGDEPTQSIELDIQVVRDLEAYPIFRVPNAQAACRGVVHSVTERPPEQQCCELKYFDFTLSDEDSDDGDLDDENCIHEKLSEEEVLQYLFFRQGKLRMSITPRSTSAVEVEMCVDPEPLETKQIESESPNEKLKDTAPPAKSEPESPNDKLKVTTTPPTNPLTTDQSKTLTSAQQNDFSLEKARSLSIWSPERLRFSRFFRKTSTTTPQVSDINIVLKDTALEPCSSSSPGVEPKKLFDADMHQKSISASKSLSSGSTTSHTSHLPPESVTSHTSRNPLELVVQLDFESTAEIASAAKNGRATSATSLSGSSLNGERESREPRQLEDRSMLSHPRKSWVVEIESDDCPLGDKSILTQHTLDSKAQSRSLMERLSNWAPTWTRTKEQIPDEKPLLTFIIDDDVSGILPTETFDVITKHITTLEDEATVGNSVLTTVPRPGDVLCGPGLVSNLLDCSASPNHTDRQDEMEIKFTEDDSASHLSQIFDARTHVHVRRS